MNDPTIPSFSERLWSDEVGLADPEAGIVVHGGSYRFGSGRVRSDNSLYDPRPALDIDADLTEAAQAIDLCQYPANQLATITEAAGAHDDCSQETETPGMPQTFSAVQLEAAGALAQAGNTLNAAAAISNAAAASATSATTAVLHAAASATATAADTPAAISSNGGLAATLFVSSTGSNSNNGTSILTPFLTIAKAASVAVPGDVVSVADGYYKGGFVTSCAGTPGHPITFVAASRWGAKIVPPAASATDIAWQNNGAYVLLDGFECDGTLDPASGPRWRIGLRVNGQGSVVQNCHVHHIYRNGVETSSGGSGILLDSAFGGMDMHATANVVHHIGAAVGNTGLWFHGIYITASGSVKNNVVGVASGGGVQAWHDVHDLAIAHNTIYACQVGVIYGGGDYVNLSGPADYISVTDNILFGNGTGVRELGDLGSHNVIANNNANSNGSNYVLVVTAHSGDIGGNPMFVNYQADGSGNYALAAGSPDHGTASDGGNVGAL